MNNFDTLRKDREIVRKWAENLLALQLVTNRKRFLLFAEVWGCHNTGGHEVRFALLDKRYPALVINDTCSVLLNIDNFTTATTGSSSARTAIYSSSSSSSSSPGKSSTTPSSSST